MAGFLRWLTAERGLTFGDYRALHRWSVTDVEGFWSAVWEFCGVRSHTPYTRVLATPDMPGARWFPGATLNYAEQALGRAHPGVADDDVAVHGYSQTRAPVTLTWAELRDRVGAACEGLRRLGVREGDRVVAYLPNIPETVVAYLAVTSLGAIWASCAPEFGATAVIDRFRQLEPQVLLAVSGYRYGTKQVDRMPDVAEIRAGLPTVRTVVEVPYGARNIPGSVSWDELLSRRAEPTFVPVPFDHPLHVLFSSGTTGAPKAIVHGHGGMVVEHLKNHTLSWDLSAGDTVQWFTTTAWMMWNALVSGLLVGASIVLIDGNPAYPGLSWQWELAADTGAALLGASPGFLMACRAAGLTPSRDRDLSALCQLGVAGSPLPAEGYDWVIDQFDGRVLLNVGSGGTELCTGIVQGGPWLPVWRGEISGPCLGVAAAAFDEHGHEVVGEPGELVITQPLPSMPLGLWGDTDGSRYRSAYFETYPGVWRHGDWARFTATGSCHIAGRSDATLNRGGVRLGTAEFYGVVERIPEVADSLVVHLEDDGDVGRLLLFVALEDGNELDDALRASIADALRTSLSPRHVPDAITAVPAIPRNRTGKKLEVPVKRILLGAAIDDALTRDALADPGAVDALITLAGHDTA